MCFVLDVSSGLMNALGTKESKAQVKFTASIWFQTHMHNGRFSKSKQTNKSLSRFPRKGIVLLEL